MMRDGEIVELIKRLIERRTSVAVESDQHELDTLIEWERESGAGLEMIREMEGRFRQRWSYRRHSC